MIYLLFQLGEIVINENQSCQLSSYIFQDYFLKFNTMI